jgi:hypothetical protein
VAIKVALDLHDFSIVNNRLELLLKLKEKYPNFKVSLFTVPFDSKEDWGPWLLRDKYLKEIKDNLDWIQIIPHGLYHNGREVSRWDYKYTKNIAIPKILVEFNSLGIPIEKGFCAPHWKWNKDVVKALDELGWWGAIWGNESIPCTKRFYKASTRIDEEFSLDNDLKLHGHIYGTKNDLGICLENLMRLPSDTEWYFVTDFLEEL